MPVDEDTPLNPMSPYGASKAMTERMLADSTAAYGLRSVALRYFNVAGADPKGRAGQSTRGATHILKVAIEAATGQREHVAVFGTDYDTSDGTGVRDYIHVNDLVRAHSAALDYLQRRRREPHPELRLRPRLFGAGAARRGAAGFRPHARHPRPRAPPRRHAGDDRRAPSRIHETLAWQPRYDDIETIVAHALAWEEQLLRKRLAA